MTESLGSRGALRFLVILGIVSLFADAALAGSELVSVAAAVGLRHGCRFIRARRHVRKASPTSLKIVCRF
jgi:hypothetical protein